METASESRSPFPKCQHVRSQATVGPWRRPFHDPHRDRALESAREPLLLPPSSLPGSRSAGSGGSANDATWIALPLSRCCLLPRPEPIRRLALVSPTRSPDGSEANGWCPYTRRALINRASLAPRSSSLTAADGSSGATLILSGEVTRSGDQVGVTARLSDARGGDAIWSEPFRVRADELFSLENVIAERIVAALDLRLAASEQEQLRRRYTSNAAAYEDYLRGRADLVRYRPEATRRAIEDFEKALEKDPGYALARAGLAMACADMFLRFAPSGEAERWGERAEAEVRTALHLDPNLAEAHLARAAAARKREFDWATVLSASQRALVLNPNLEQAHFFIGAAYYHLGYFQEALIETDKGRRASRRRPDRPDPQ